MIRYEADIAGDQVICTIHAVDNPSLTDYQSEDGFLTLQRVRGGSDGWLGYGGLCVTFDDRYLPLTLESPHYEHAQDLTDLMERITRNMEIVNGDVLP